MPQKLSNEFSTYLHTGIVFARAQSPPFDILSLNARLIPFSTIALPCYLQNYPR